jgi:putative hydrolases of HD superfamily
MVCRSTNERKYRSWIVLLLFVIPQKFGLIVYGSHQVLAFHKSAFTLLLRSHSLTGIGRCLHQHHTSLFAMESPSNKVDTAHTDSKFVDSLNSTTTAEQQIYTDSTIHDHNNNNNNTTLTATTTHAVAVAAAIEFAQIVGRLKSTPRTGWVRRNVPRYESVADHSWRVAILSFLLCGYTTHHDDDNTDTDCLDIGKVIQLAIVHDLAECIVGDITPDDNISKADKQRLEEDAMIHISEIFHRAIGVSNHTSIDTDVPNVLMALFHEYEERITPEAIAVKDLDLLDMILQASEYEERYGIDLNEFFVGTPSHRFQNSKLRPIASQVHQQRQNRIMKQKDQTEHKSDEHHLSRSDAAFVLEYSQASTLSDREIMNVVQSLRQWEDRNSSV